MVYRTVCFEYPFTSSITYRISDTTLVTIVGRACLTNQEYLICLKIIMIIHSRGRNCLVFNADGNSGKDVLFSCVI